MIFKLIGLVFLAVIFILIICATSYNHGKCYSEMVKRGIAANGVCDGLVGGTKNTGYLQEMCINCPFCHYTKDSFKLYLHI